MRYKNTRRNRAINGNRSKKNEKNKNSEIKNIDPGKPRKIKLFSKTIRNNFGVIKFIPLISVNKRVLNHLAIASTSKNEFVESSAWLISMQKLASIKLDCPLIIQIVNQCISTTVEYATSFLDQFDKII